MNALNQMNIIMNSGLSRAMGCLYHLADQGCTVTRVEVERARPVLWVDQPPPSPFIRGALRRREVIGGEQIMVRVASVMDCHVQWIERRRLHQQKATA